MIKKIIISFFQKPSAEQIVVEPNYIVSPLVEVQYQNELDAVLLAIKQMQGDQNPIEQRSIFYQKKYELFEKAYDYFQVKCNESNLSSREIECFYALLSKGYEKAEEFYFSLLKDVLPNVFNDFTPSEFLNAQITEVHDIEIVFISALLKKDLSLIKHLLTQEKHHQSALIQITIAIAYHHGFGIEKNCTKAFQRYTCRQ